MPAKGVKSSLATSWAWTMEPKTNDILLFADDGIFMVTAYEG
jgi:hypothetical protein